MGGVLPGSACYAGQASFRKDVRAASGHAGLYLSRIGPRSRPKPVEPGPSLAEAGPNPDEVGQIRATRGRQLFGNFRITLLSVPSRANTEPPTSRRLTLELGGSSKCGGTYVSSWMCSAPKVPRQLPRQCSKQCFVLPHRGPLRVGQNKFKKSQTEVKKGSASTTFLGTLSDLSSATVGAI